MSEEEERENALKEAFGKTDKPESQENSDNKEAGTDQPPPEKASPSISEPSQAEGSQDEGNATDGKSAETADPNSDDKGTGAKLDDDKNHPNEKEEEILPDDPEELKRMVKSERQRRVKTAKDWQRKNSEVHRTQRQLEQANQKYEESQRKAEELEEQIKKAPEEETSEFTDEEMTDADELRELHAGFDAATLKALKSQGIDIDALKKATENLKKEPETKAPDSTDDTLPDEMSDEEIATVNERGDKLAELDPDAPMLLNSPEFQSWEQKHPELIAIAVDGRDLGEPSVALDVIAAYKNTMKANEKIARPVQSSPDSKLPTDVPTEVKKKRDILDDTATLSPNSSSGGETTPASPDKNDKNRALRDAFGKGS